MYIKREDAIEALGERPINWTDSDSEIQEVFDYDMHLSAIESVPSADVVERELCGECVCGKCEKNIRNLEGIDEDYCTLFGYDIEYDDFCSYAEHI